MTDLQRPFTTPLPAPGRDQLAARTAERCERCGVERPWGALSACRCAEPRWRTFCTRCARSFGDGCLTMGPGGPPPAPICPACLATGETNGRKLRGSLDARLASIGTVATVTEGWDRLRLRATQAVSEFGLDAALGAVPPWVAGLADKSRPLPPGVEHARRKMDAVTALRVEEAGVRVALDRLGYLARPVEDKLARAIEAGDRASAMLGSWDGIAASADHEQLLKDAASALLGAAEAMRALVDSIRKRDLGPVVEAAVRRQRAIDQCRTALGID